MNEHVEAGSTPAAPSPTQLADCDAGQLAHDRYLDALHDLVEDAASGGHLRQLADVVAWTIARIAVGCGPSATGDMLALIGKYMVGIDAQNEAKRELERQRAAGHLPN